MKLVGRGGKKAASKARALGQGVLALDLWLFIQLDLSRPVVYAWPFQPQHATRVFAERCRAILKSPRFERGFLLIVLLNCVAIALDTPFLDPDSGTRLLTDWSAPVFTLCFALEFVLKIYAEGFFLGDRAYFNPENPDHHWNVLDLLILASCVLDHAYTLMIGGDNKLFRALRAARALRLIDQIEGLQHLVTALLQSLIALGSVIGKKPTVTTIAHESSVFLSIYLDAW